MKHHAHILGSFAALTLIVGCASTGDAEPDGAAAFAEDARLGEKVDRICFASQIDNFRATTKKTLIIEEGVNEEYLVEVFGACFNLRNAQSIGIDAHSSCLRRGDNLIVSDNVFSLNDRTGIGPQRCAVQAIYEWDEDAAMIEVAETAAP